MNATMKAVRLHGPGDLRLDTIPIPQPGPGEVLVKVHRCAVCGTDLHITRGDFPAPNLPLVLGHEFSGTITALGAGVDKPAVGDRVVVDINMACGTCYFCRRGQKLFCPTVSQLGVHTAGGFAEYVTAPASNVIIIPESLSLDAATSVEPLACVVHGQDRIGVTSGDTVLIIGGGFMGLLHTVVSRLRGAARVVVSEPDPNRRARAERLGADVAVDPMAVDLGEILASLTAGVGPDIVIEAVGSIPTYESALQLVRRGGKILVYGAAPATADMRVRPFDIYAKELSIIGSYAGTYDTWPRAIELLAGKRVDPSLIVDSVRSLDEAVDAIKGLATDKSTVKIHIQV